MDQEDLNQEESGPIGYYDVEEAIPYQGGHFTQSEVDDDNKNTFVYEKKEATAMAVVLCQIRDQFQARSLQYGNQYVTTYSLQRGVKEFGEQGKQAD